MKKTKPNFELVTLDLPTELLNRIKEVAVELDVSMEDLIRVILYLEVSREEGKRPLSQRAN